MQGLPRKLAPDVTTRALAICTAVMAAGALMPAALMPAAGAADSRVAAEFSLTFAELEAMTKSLPPGIRSGILASPQDFLHLVAGVFLSIAPFRRP